MCRRTRKKPIRVLRWRRAGGDKKTRHYADWGEIEPTLRAPQSLTLLKADFWEGQANASFDDLIANLPANDAPRSKNGD